MIEFTRLAPFCWEARERITPHAWVKAEGWCRRTARRNLMRLRVRS